MPYVNDDMCAGISLSITDIPEDVFEQFHLADRIKASKDTGELEIHFLFRDPTAQLPVEEHESIGVHLWGNRNDTRSKLPRTGWCRADSLKAGKWNFLDPLDVIIPARRGIEKGVWFPIDRGIRGILVHDETDRPHVYMVTEAASKKYLELTGHTRMPVFA